VVEFKKILNFSQEWLSLKNTQFYPRVVRFKEYLVLAKSGRVQRILNFIQEWLGLSNTQEVIHKWLCLQAIIKGLTRIGYVTTILKGLFKSGYESKE